MITAIVIFVIGMIITYHLASDVCDGILQYILAFFVGVFFTTLIGMAILIVISSVFGPVDYTDKLEYDLVSINDGQTLNGSFILGSGYIGEKLVYTYYRKDKNGGIVRKSISSDLTTIYECDSTEKPRVVVNIIPRFANSNWLLFNRYRGWQKYHLFIPKGSIIKEVKLDNQ